MNGQDLNNPSSTTGSAVSTALLVFTQSPGHENKRLGLGPVRSAGLLSRLQRHTFREVRRCRTPHARFIATDRPEAVLAGARAIGARVFGQEGASFEERLLGALARLADLGYERAVVIGTDTPGFRGADLDRALHLDSGASPSAGDTLVGPARDGGFYLLSFPLRHLSRLRGLPWQRRGLLNEVVRRFRAVSRVRFLRTRTDVDSAADVRALQARLHALTRERGDTSLLRTALSRWVPVDAVIPLNPRAVHLQGPDRAPPSFDFL